MSRDAAVHESGCALAPSSGPLGLSFTTGIGGAADLSSTRSYSDCRGVAELGGKPEHVNFMRYCPDGLRTVRFRDRRDLRVVDAR